MFDHEGPLINFWCCVKCIVQWSGPNECFVCGEPGEARHQKDPEGWPKLRITPDNIPFGYPRGMAQ